MPLVQCTWMINAISEYLVEKDTLSSTVMGTFNSKSRGQLHTCSSFISLECEMENGLSKLDHQNRTRANDGSVAGTLC